MYRIIKTDGTTLGITDNVTWIRFGQGDYFTNATQDNAIGVVFQNNTYNFIGHDEIPDAETVIVQKIDAGATMHDLTTTLNILLGVND